MAELPNPLSLTHTDKGSIYLKMRKLITIFLLTVRKISHGMKWFPLDLADYVYCKTEKYIFIPVLIFARSVL